VTCTKTGSKNDLFLNRRRKPKELSKKELSNVAPASGMSPLNFESKKEEKKLKQFCPTSV
jgi:hypothetical protein